MIEILRRFRPLLSRSNSSNSRKPDLVYPDDAFLVSYPRSGNAWLRRLVTAMRDPTYDLVSTPIEEYIPDVYQDERTLADHERPRIMKSHELYQPTYPKVVYLVRDGRDVACSYYNYYVTIKDYSGTFRDFLDIFLAGQVSFGAWHEHVCSWLLKEHSSKLLHIKYEQLHVDPYNTLDKLASFLGLPVDSTCIDHAYEVCTVDKQREYVRRWSPYYERGFTGGISGNPGSWERYFDPKLSAKFWRQAGQAMHILGYPRDS